MANKYLAKYKRKQQPFLLDISPDDELEVDFIKMEMRDIQGEQAISDDLQLSKAEKDALQKDIRNRIMVLKKRAKKINCPVRKRKILKEINALKRGSAALLDDATMSVLVPLLMGGTSTYFVSLFNYKYPTLKAKLEAQPVFYGGTFLFVTALTRFLFTK